MLMKTTIAITFAIFLTCAACSQSGAETRPNPGAQIGGEVGGEAGSNAIATQRNVLFIGDSLSDGQVTGLGRNLTLPSNEFRLKVAAFCGYRPLNYTNASAVGKKPSICGHYMRNEDGSLNNGDLPPLSTLMSFSGGSKKADIVVIQLGTNMYDTSTFASGSVSSRAVTIESATLLKKILSINPKAILLWLAPPKIWSFGGRQVAASVSDSMFNAITAAVDATNSHAGSEIVGIIDSREYTDVPPHGYKIVHGKRKSIGDGTHFGVLQQRWLAITTQSIEGIAKKLK
jgi:hypothetical protein